MRKPASFASSAGSASRAQSLFGNSRVSVSAQQVSAYGDEEHGVGNVDAALVVAHEPPPASHPSKGALDYPSARKNLEATLAFGSANDLEQEVEIGGLVHELEPVIGCVREQVLHPGPALADGIEDRLSAGRVGDVGGRQVHH